MPIEKQNNVIAFLLSQPIILNNSSLQSFSLGNSREKDFRENIRLFRNGNFFDLIFEAETLESAQHGLEVWFSAFSKAIIKQKQKLLLMEQKTTQQYDKNEIFDIVHGFRSSVDSFVYHNVKQTELHDLSVQLTEATLKRIHLTSLNSTISIARENGQSLLSLSFIASHPMISALETKRNLLETQRAHMVVQLGWTHPQIKAMTAELEAVSQQLENKILQIVHQFHSDEILAIEFEKQLKKRMSFFAKDQSQSLNQMFDELEHRIRAVVALQSKEMSKDFSLLQNIKVQVVVPTTLTEIPFMDLYGKNFIISVFTSLITLLGGVLLFRQYPMIRKNKLRENHKNSESTFVSERMKELEFFVTIEGLSDFLKRHTAVLISIIGPEAARTAAKLSLHLIKEHKTILLVDISGQQIEKVIGPHRGLSDILTGNAQLQDVIYRDYDTGVDILPQGLTSAVSAQDFSNDIPNLLQEFKKDYDFILLEMESEPKYGVEQFARLTDHYICSVALDEQDWILKMVRQFPKTVYRVVASSIP
ncbi:hypothetical protein GCM10023262_06640 [Bartonella pachyuromydis]|uniref:Uncharacterized protein n=1 Tax=Bartonella pachyuromydis TaxID=931097 RepID=A0ABP8VEY6_9HYPH